LLALFARCLALQVCGTQCNPVPLLSLGPSLSGPLREVLFQDGGVSWDQLTHPLTISPVKPLKLLQEGMYEKYCIPLRTQSLPYFNSFPPFPSIFCSFLRLDQVKFVFDLFQEIILTTSPCNRSPHLLFLGSTLQVYLDLLSFPLYISDISRYLLLLGVLNTGNLGKISL